MNNTKFLTGIFYKKLVSVYNDFLLMKPVSRILPKLKTLITLKPNYISPSYDATIKAAAVYKGCTLASTYLKSYLHIWIEIQLMISGLSKNTPIYKHIRKLSKSPNLYPILRTSYVL
jgi:hypothetical protein